MNAVPAANTDCTDAELLMLQQALCGRHDEAPDLQFGEAERRLRIGAHPIIAWQHADCASFAARSGCVVTPLQADRDRELQQLTETALPR